MGVASINWVPSTGRKFYKFGYKCRQRTKTAPLRAFDHQQKALRLVAISSLQLVVKMTPTKNPVIIVSVDEPSNEASEHLQLGDDYLLSETKASTLCSISGKTYAIRT